MDKTKNNMEFRDGLYFYPHFDENQWDLPWLDQLRAYIPISLQKVAAFIPRTSPPEFVLFHPDKVMKAKTSKLLPEWSKALAVEFHITIFFHQAVDNWQGIIDHEVFHVSVYQLAQGKKIIPVWLNEAIAHFIGENYILKQDKFDVGIKMDLKCIQQYLLEDTLTQSCPNPTVILKNVAFFIKELYSPNDIYHFFVLLQKSEIFEKAFMIAFHHSPKEFIELWLRRMTKDPPATT